VAERGRASERGKSQSREFIDMCEQVIVEALLREGGEILPLPFLRYRFCELKYRGAVGRRQVHCTLIVKIIRFYC
jgi:hypothetical protein